MWRAARSRSRAGKGVWPRDGLAGWPGETQRLLGGGRRRRAVQLHRRALRSVGRRRQPAAPGGRHAAHDHGRRRLRASAQRGLGIHPGARGARRAGRAARLAAAPEGRHRPAGRGRARPRPVQAADRWRRRAEPRRHPHADLAPDHGQCLRHHGAACRWPAARPARPASGAFGRSAQRVARRRRPRTRRSGRPSLRPCRRGARACKAFRQ